MRQEASEPRCLEAHSATIIGRDRAGYPGGSATRTVAPPPPNRTVDFVGHEIHWQTVTSKNVTTMDGEHDDIVITGRTTDAAVVEIKEKKEKAGAGAGGGMDDFDY